MSKLYAMKIFDKETLEEGSSLRQLIDEIRYQRKVSSTCQSALKILRVHETRRSIKLLYPYIEGGDLGK